MAGPAVAPAAMAPPSAIAPATASTTVIKAATSTVRPLFEGPMDLLNLRHGLRDGFGDGRGARLGLRRDRFFDRSVCGSSFDGGFRDDTTVYGGRSKHFAALLWHVLRNTLDFRRHRRRDVVVVLKMFQEIADVQKCIAIEADVHEG